MLLNKYFIEYNKIIDKALSENRKREGDIYYENHHIIPRSIRPDLENDESNQVILTAQEHFRCHEILPLFLEGENKEKMIYSWNMMKNCNDIEIDAELYEKLKVEWSITHSKNMKGRESHRRGLSLEEEYGKERAKEIRKKISENHADVSGKNNPMYGSHRIGEDNPMYGKKHSKETKEKMRQKAKGREGYWKDKKIPEDVKEKMRVPKSKIICPHCGKVGGSNAMKRWHFDNCKMK